MIGVVIPSFNSAHCVGACIEAVRGQLGDCEVIVVDNASTDATVEMAETAGEQVRVIQLGRNSGFGTAANAGVAAADAENILLLNPDVRLISADLAWLTTPITAVFRGLHAIDHRAGSRQGGSLLRRERPWWWEGLGRVLAPFWPREVTWRPPTLPLGPVWASGAALTLRRSEFLDLGGFDERFFMYNEDRDLSRRYDAARLPVGVTTAIRAVHGHGDSTAGLPADSPTRQAWSLLASIEYLALAVGFTDARRAAELRLYGMNAAAALMEWLARRGLLAPRTGAKVEELRSVQRYLHRWLRCSLPASDPLTDTSYYPQARSIFNSCL